MDEDLLELFERLVVAVEAIAEGFDDLDDGRKFLRIAGSVDTYDG